MALRGQQTPAAAAAAAAPAKSIPRHGMAQASQMIARPKSVRGEPANQNKRSRDAEMRHQQPFHDIKRERVQHRGAAITHECALLICD